MGEDQVLDCNTVNGVPTDIRCVDNLPLRPAGVGAVTGPDPLVAAAEAARAAGVPFNPATFVPPQQTPGGSLPGTGNVGTPGNPDSGAQPLPGTNSAGAAGTVTPSTPGAGSQPIPGGTTPATSGAAGTPSTPGAGAQPIPGLGGITPATPSAAGPLPAGASTPGAPTPAISVSPSPPATSNPTSSTPAASSPQGSPSTQAPTPAATATSPQAFGPAPALTPEAAAALAPFVRIAEPPLADLASLISRRAKPYTVPGPLSLTGPLNFGAALPPLPQRQDPTGKFNPVLIDPTLDPSNGPVHGPMVGPRFPIPVPKDIAGFSAPAPGPAGAQRPEGTSVPSPPPPAQTLPPVPTSPATPTPTAAPGTPVPGNTTGTVTNSTGVATPTTQSPSDGFNAGASDSNPGDATSQAGPPLPPPEAAPGPDTIVIPDGDIPLPTDPILGGGSVNGTNGNVPAGPGSSGK